MSKGRILDRTRRIVNGAEVKPGAIDVLFPAVVQDPSEQDLSLHRAGARAPVANDVSTRTQSQVFTKENMDATVQDLTGHATIFNGLTGSTLSLRKKRVGGL